MKNKPRLINGDASTVNFLLIKNQKVVKKTPKDKTLKQEATALKIAYEHGVPVPCLRFYEKGSLYIDYVPGLNVGDSVINTRLLKKVANVIRKLHSVHHYKIGDFEKPLENNIKNWTNFLAKSFKMTSSPDSRTSSFRPGFPWSS